MTALRYVTALGLVVGLAWSLCGFLGSWPADMITPFRPQLLFLAFAALALSVLLKRRWLIVLAGVVVTANALPMAVRLLERPVLPARTAGTGKPVSLVFSNVLCDNRAFGKVIAMAQAQDADVFAAAETSPPWLKQLPALAAKYPYSFAPNVGIFGVAIFAKRPFTAELYRVGEHGMALARAEFSDYVLYVAHPMPPASAGLSEDNRIYIEDLAARVATEHKPVIVAGDLNATLWSHNLRPLIRQKMQWPHGSGLAHSWPTQRAVMAIQIDQILTKGAVAGTYRVLGDVGSDHYPVRADLVF